MCWTLRVAVLSSFLIALAAAGLFAYPSWAEDAGVDIWHVVDDQRRVAAAEETERVLARETELTAQRIAIRAEAVRELVDGRATFDEVTRRFAELNRAQPGQMAEYVRRRYPGRTDEERAARQLISHLVMSREPAAVALGEEWECVLAGQE